MIFKIGTITVGIGCLWYGFSILRTGWSYLYGYPISRATGVIVLIFGIFLILYGWFRKAEDKQDHEKLLICTNCRKIFKIREISQNQCPSCKSDLEKLDGFYERHPELKEK